MAKLKRLESQAPASSPKRRRTTAKPVTADDSEDDLALSPANNAINGEDSPNNDDDDAVEPENEVPAVTPSKRKRGRPPKSTTTNGDKSSTIIPGTPSASRKTDAVQTPARRLIGRHAEDTPGRRTIADRSARRKSARALINHVMGEASSDEDAEEDDLVRAIYESSEGEDEAEEEGLDDDRGIEGETDAEKDAATPSRTGRGRKKKAVGRTPTRTRQRSPTPPTDLPSYEQYFHQTKPGMANKTSNNTLNSLDLLTHEEYFVLLPQWQDRHAEDIQYLESLHANSFPQWLFELSQGYSVCLYGYGSKKRLLTNLATQIYHQGRHTGSGLDRIIVINGYLRATTPREILAAVGKALDPSYKLPAGTSISQAQDVLARLSAYDGTITLIVHAADAAPLRRAGAQAVLAQLAAHPRVQFVCGTDTADFALLWDAAARAAFNFVFHDATTFAPYAPAEVDVVDEVHELVGRKARRVGGKDGVVFVLRSLPENARSLFRLLVGEVLVALEDDGDGDGGAGLEGPGIEYRALYNKAVEEFICSSEMAYRLLLKEFHDHQIITSRQDAIGTEILSLPFRKDELEAVLEDLVS